MRTAIYLLSLKVYKGLFYLNLITIIILFKYLSKTIRIQFRDSSKWSLYFCLNLLIFKVLKDNYFESSSVEFVQITADIYLAYLLIIVAFVSLLENSLLENSLVESDDACKENNNTLYRATNTRLNILAAKRYSITSLTLSRKFSSSRVLRVDDGSAESSLPETSLARKEEALDREIKHIEKNLKFDLNKHKFALLNNNPAATANQAEATQKLALTCHYDKFTLIERVWPNHHCNEVLKEALYKAKHEKAMLLAANQKVTLGSYYTSDYKGIPFKPQENIFITIPILMYNKFSFYLKNFITRYCSSIANPVGWLMLVISVYLYPFIHGFISSSVNYCITTSFNDLLCLLIYFLVLRVLYLIISDLYSFLFSKLKYYYYYLKKK